METGQESAIVGNSPFPDWQMVEMGVTKIFAKQEYTHVYLMWKSVQTNQGIQVRFKEYFQKAYLDRDALKQIAGEAGYGSANNVKHGEMEHASMKFSSATAAQYAAFIKLTTKNVNMSTQLRQQEDQIWSLQDHLFNLKLTAATQTTDVKGNNKGVHPYAPKRKHKPQWPTDPMEEKYNNKNYCWYHGYDTSNPHTLETCTRKFFMHEDKAMRCNPMGVSQNNRACVRKKV